MKPWEIEKASVSDLLARYARVRIDANRFETLAKKAKDEREAIYRELVSIRRISSGLYIVDGRKLDIKTGNGINISTPKFVDIEKYKRQE